MTLAVAAHRDKKRDHLWRPGQSGNPKGRPKGSRNDPLRALDAMVEAGARDALAVVLALARAGNLHACEILLDRAWPPRGPA